jgi:mono/diheme cytochrome c family protein
MMVSKIQTGLIAGCLLVGLAGVGRAAERPEPDAAAKGKVIYQRYCASCHGSDARGDGPLAADLKVPPGDLTRLAEKANGRFPFDLVARSIDGRQTTRGHGTPDMPVWGEIFPKTAGTESPSTSSAVGRIAHYLWSIQAARQ